MHPTIEYQLTKAQIAARHRHAEQTALIHATRQAGSTAPRRRARLAGALAHRLLARLAACGRVVRAPARPLPACSLSAPRLTAAIARAVRWTPRFRQ